MNILNVKIEKNVIYSSNDQHSLSASQEMFGSFCHLQSRKRMIMLNVKILIEKLWPQKLLSIIDEVVMSTCYLLRSRLGFFLAIDKNIKP